MTQTAWSGKAVLRKVALAGIGLVLSTGALALSGARAWAEPGKSEAKAPAASDKDVVVFRNGNRVEGTILEETATSIRMRVVIAGIAGETVYQKAEILNITRAAKGDEAQPGAGDKPADKPAAKPEAKPAPKGSGAPAKADGKNRIYVINMTGEFGRDVSHTPMQKVLEDIREAQPDVLVLKFDHEFKLGGQEMEEYAADPRGFDIGLESARQISTLLTDAIRDDPGFTTKPRLVGWIRRAMGPAAFLPFVCPELYYTPDGRHGGLGFLEQMLKGVGDEVAQEKQYSLRQARAEGLANKGGHNPMIVRAMARGDFVLSVKFEDGKPVLVNRMPENADEILLKNDATKEENRDALQDLIRLRGKNVLRLDAEMAQRIGLSKGTAATIDDLADQLGLGRDYTVVENKSERILKEWSDAITRAEDNFRRLFRDFDRVEIRAPGGFRERTAARGQRLRILREVQSILKNYKESINPRRIQGAPEGWMDRIELMIAGIEQEQRADRPE